MKKHIIVLIILSFISIIVYSKPSVILEEVVLRDSIMISSLSKIIKKNSKCFSLKVVEYYAFDYCPSTLAKNEFYIYLFPADLTDEEMRKLGYYFVINDIPFVLPRDIPKWFYNKTGKKRLFTILFDREMEAKWQAGYDVPIIDDREFIRSIPWILIRGENQTLKQPIDSYLCFCGKER